MSFLLARHIRLGGVNGTSKSIQSLKGLTSPHHPQSHDDDPHPLRFSAGSRSAATGGQRFGPSRPTHRPRPMDRGEEKAKAIEAAEANVTVFAEVAERRGEWGR